MYFPLKNRVASSGGESEWLRPPDHVNGIFCLLAAQDGASCDKLAGTETYKTLRVSTFSFA